MPLYKALSYGAASVEADIFLVNDELLVSKWSFIAATLGQELRVYPDRPHIAGSVSRTHTVIVIPETAYWAD